MDLVLMNTDGTFRVVIQKRSDGLFTYSHEQLDYVYNSYMRKRLNDFTMMWIPVGPPGGLFDTEAAAQEEARRLIER